MNLEMGVFCVLVETFSKTERETRGVELGLERNETWGDRSRLHKLVVVFKLERVKDGKSCCSYGEDCN